MDIANDFHAIFSDNGEQTIDFPFAVRAMNRKFSTRIPDNAEMDNIAGNIDIADIISRNAKVDNVSLKDTGSILAPVQHSGELSDGIRLHADAFGHDMLAIHFRNHADAYNIVYLAETRRNPVYPFAVIRALSTEQYFTLHRFHLQSVTRWP